MTKLENLKKISAKKKMVTKYIDKRNQIWQPMSSVEENTRILWEQKIKKGFVNIPRVMPLILNIMDYLVKKIDGKPVGSTYFALWCRDFGTAFVEIKDSDELASEADFSGSRATTTLNSRIKLLNKEADNGLGFIRTQKTSTGKYKFILMLNPLLIIHLHYNQGNIPKAMYDELYSRCADVGDNNLKVIGDAGEGCIEKTTNFLYSLKDS